MTGRPQLERTIGLGGATGIGVGAIVGGGILALAGVAFEKTGPGAILAFALNGVIALITVLSFSELATRFPESGGTYSFARRVLSIEAAFTVGWVVWFASVVAAVLYALGFGAFLLLAVERALTSSGSAAPEWMRSRAAVMLLACAAAGVLSVGLVRRAGGGGPWLNIGKVLVFSVLIAGGLWKLVGEPPAEVREDLTDFLPAGGLGLVTAMGYTFIALQGFDLIAAVGGEVKDPRRTIPRAMFYSLGIALVIYLPLLFIVVTVGMRPGDSVTEVSAQQPEAVVAIAARNYLGSFGYWLVLVAGVLSMLSALQANLLAASRVALAMATDKTLPHWFSGRHRTRSTPVAAILATAVIVILVIAAVPDVASAGAASSLVFLLTFALVHMINMMARKRAGIDPKAFVTPWYPAAPILGASACVGLAVFQGFSVPTAGLIAFGWLIVGGVLYTLVLSRRARAVDALSVSIDSELAQLRGHSPLVLVPLANPENAEAMVGVADALAPPLVGRVLLLTIVPPPKEDVEGAINRLESAQAVLGKALTASFSRGLRPEVLATVAPEPWGEIERVARTHGCESLLLGFHQLTEDGVGRRVESLIGEVDCEVVVLRAPASWRLQDAKRVLVPIAGRGSHDALRARLLGSIHRLGARAITLLRIVPESATERDMERARISLARIARDEAPQCGEILVERSDQPSEVIARYAQQSDLVILGLRRESRQQKSFGEIGLRVAEHTSGAVIMISRRR
jgi:amino acid transporter